MKRLKVTNVYDNYKKYISNQFSEGYYLIVETTKNMRAVYKVDKDKKGILINQSPNSIFIDVFSFNSGHSAKAHKIYRLSKSESFLEAL